MGPLLSMQIVIISFILTKNIYKVSGFIYRLYCKPNYVIRFSFFFVSKRFIVPPSISLKNIITGRT